MNSVGGDTGGTIDGEQGNTVEHVKEFMKGVAEMSVQLARGCRDIVRQTLGNENSFLGKHLGKDSYIASKIRGPCVVACERLKCFNEYLPEDKDPLHAWSVICVVVVVALAGKFRILIRWVRPQVELQ